MAAGDNGPMGKHHSPQTRQKLSEAGKRKWQDPAYRQKQLAVLKSGREISRQQRKNLAVVKVPLPAPAAEAPPPTKSQKTPLKAKTEARSADSPPGKLSLKGESKHIVISYNQYLRSREWQCPPSHTGAHHWIIIGDKMRCKYCHEEKMVKPYYYADPMA